MLALGHDRIVKEQREIERARHAHPQSVRNVRGRHRFQRSGAIGFADIRT
jgi:hypothetical protein